MIINSDSIKALYDTTASLHVLSYLMHEPLLLQDDRYTLTKTDFDPKPLHSIIYYVIYNLAQKGLQTITPTDIDAQVQQYDAQYAYYQKQGGFTWINECYQMAESEGNFDKNRFKIYYDRVKKFSVLRDLERQGVDTKRWYDPNKDALNKDIEDDKLDKTSVSAILNDVRTELAEIEDKHVGKNSESSQDINKGMRELFAQLKKTPEIGLPLDGKIVNYATSGAREGKMYTYSAPTGMGKALPNSTLIPMANGSWKQVGDVKEGDYLFDRHGKPTRVLKIFPQGQKDVYKIIFKDGRIALCNDEHLWTYHNCCSRDNKLITSTLKEIIEKAEKLGYQSCRQWRFNVPLNEPVQYREEKQLSFDPYLLGLLIGDGSFREQPTNRNLSFSSKNEELLLPFVSIGWGYKKRSESNYNYDFKIHGENIHIREFCDKYNLQGLYNKYSYEKAIPSEYLYSSINDRLALLQGLLDTDGSVDLKGRVSFCSTSPQLINQVQQLCRSLGLIATITQDKRILKYTNGQCYELHIIGKPEIKRKLFRLQGKKEKIEHWFLSNKTKYNYDYNPIVKIEKLDYQEEMTCFLVDNDEHLFLMNDYIVTHNTRYMVDNACAISMPYIDENCKIIARDDYQKVLFVATEMKADEIQTMVLAHVSGVKEDAILYGRCTAEEEKRIQLAFQIIDTYGKNFIVDCIPDPSIELIKARLTRFILQDDIHYIFYDYIFSSPGLLGEFRDVGVREDVALMMLSNTLKEIAMTYGVFVQSATQLNDGWSKKELGIRDQNMIRGSKAIIDKADCGIIGVKLVEGSPEWKQIEEIWSKIKYKEEFQGIKAPNLVLDIYKNRRGPMNFVKIFRYFDFATCRCKDLFITDQNYTPIQPEEIEYHISKYTSLDEMVKQTQKEEE